MCAHAAIDGLKAAGAWTPFVPRGGWPDFLIIGAEKSGTTSLHAYLDQHPGIWMLPERELGFFGPVWKHAGPEGRLDEETRAYLERFKAAPDGAVTGECSNSYLWHHDVPGRIASVAPGMKLVVLVREPVERALSHYLMNVRNGRDRRGLREAMTGDTEEGTGPRGHIQAGRYGRHLERYLEHFPLEQIHIISSSRLREAPHAVLRELCAFLGADAGPVDGIDTSKQHNPARMPRNRGAARILHSPRLRGVARILPFRVRRMLGERVLMRRIDKPTLPADIRATLEELYAPEIDRLETLTGRRFDELRQGWSERFSR